MQENDLLTIVQNELSQSNNPGDWTKALDYYLGNPRGDEVSGRSQVISTDVADAVEWIMPQIMRALFSNNEVVVFDAKSPEDEQQAELESEYVYDVLTKENNGFLVVHQFCKDALLQRFGVIKCYYEETAQHEVRSFSGLSEQMAAMVAADPGLQILEYGIGPDGAYAMKVAYSTPRGRVVLEVIPPEQFRVNPDHNSIDVSNARFTAHVTVKTVSDLIESGYDRDLIEEHAGGGGYRLSDYRFQAQGEPSGQGYDQSMDPALRELEVAECYMRLDINEDGIAERVKVTVIGYEVPTAVLSVEELEEYPWLTTTAILMSHKFQGLSIYDRLKSIQDIKTSLWRNTLDNIYLQNNQRVGVLEGQANLDDLMISRPGGIVRMKRPDAVFPLATPQIGAEAMTMMAYLDEVRAGRVGVSPEGNATPQKIGSNVGSEGVTQLLTAKEELVGLIVRVIAETGIKPLYTRVRDLLRKHTDAVQNFKFRGQWVQTNPAQWPNRTRTTVRVGTGSGDNSKRLMGIQQILQIQAQLAQMPGQALVAPAKVYSALDDLAKFNELDGASRYFTDPNSPEGQQAQTQAAQAAQQQAQQQNEQQMALMQAQSQLAQAEMGKAQAMLTNGQLKAQVEELKAQIDRLHNQQQDAAKAAELDLKKYQIDTQAAIELTKLEAQASTQQEQNAVQNREALADAA